MSVKLILETGENLFDTHPILAEYCWSLRELPNVLNDYLLANLFVWGHQTLFDNYDDNYHFFDSIDLSLELDQKEAFIIRKIENREI